MKDLNQKVPILAFIVVAIGSLYFFLDSMLAVFPSALTGQLMSKFNVAATGVSLFAAVYFYTYAPMQLPVGLILDKFGPKKIMIIGCALCTLGLTLFAYTDSFFISCVARGLMGIGACAGYLAPMLLAVRWFPHRYYIVVTGFIVLVECLGAMFGGSFISYLTNSFSLNAVILLMAGLSLVLVFLAIAFVRDHPPQSDFAKLGHIDVNWKIIRQVFSSSQNWIIGIAGALFWAPVSTFAALWGIPFLETVHHLSKSMAESLLIFIWIGIGLMSPLWGFFSNRLGLRTRPMKIGALLGLIGSFVVIYCGNPWAIGAALFVIGAASACQVFTFGLIHDRYSESKSVTAFAFGLNNMIICFGNAFFDFLSGYLLDKFSNNSSAEGVKIYSFADYTHALSIMPICYIAVFLLITFFVRETFCHHQSK